MPSSTGFGAHISSGAKLRHRDDAADRVIDERNAAGRRQGYHMWVDEQAFLRPGVETEKSGTDSLPQYQNLAEACAISADGVGSVRQNL
jgi:hypothetical protein